MKSLCENIRLSTTLEVHNILQCDQRRTEPHPQSVCTNNLKFGCMVSEIATVENRTGVGVADCNVEVQSRHDQQLAELTERFELIKVSLSVSAIEVVLFCCNLQYQCLKSKIIAF